MSALAPVLKVVRCSPSNPEPALDRAAMMATDGAAKALVAQYIETRDPECLRFVEAVTPTWFVLRRLPLAFMTGVLDQVYPRSAQRVLAFRAACHAVEGAEPLSVEAPGTKGARFEATQADAGVTLAPMEWAEEIAQVYGAEVVQEMGEIALTHSRLRRGARGPFGFWGGSVASL